MDPVTESPTEGFCFNEFVKVVEWEKKGGPTQRRGKAEILTAWASSNLEDHERSGDGEFKIFCEKR